MLFILKLLFFYQLQFNVNIFLFVCNYKFLSPFLNSLLISSIFLIFPLLNILFKTNSRVSWQVSCLSCLLLPCLLTFHCLCLYCYFFTSFFYFSQYFSLFIFCFYSSCSWSYITFCLAFLSFSFLFSFSSPFLFLLIFPLLLLFLLPMFHFVLFM